MLLLRHDDDMRPASEKQCDDEDASGPERLLYERSGRVLGEPHDGVLGGGVGVWPQAAEHPRDAGCSATTRTTPLAAVIVMSSVETSRWLLINGPVRWLVLVWVS